MQNRNYYTIILALLGVLKLFLNAFGIDLLTDNNANDIANATATILTFIGVLMTHLKGRPQLQFKMFVSNIFNKKVDTAVPVPVNAINAQVTPVIKTVQTTSETTNSSLTVAVEQPRQPEPTAPVDITNNNVQK